MAAVEENGKPKSKGKARNCTAGMKPLDICFVPGPFDVICARGKHIRDSVGNKWFRGLVSSQMGQYNACSSKLEKSYVVSQIIETVRRTSDTGGGFIKQVHGVWHAVGDRHAREKIGQTLRDLLHTKYTSSTKAKAVVRRKRAVEAATSGQKQHEEDEEEEDMLEAEEENAKEDAVDHPADVVSVGEPATPEQIKSKAGVGEPACVPKSNPTPEGKTPQSATPSKQIPSRPPPRASTWSDPRARVHPLFRNGAPKFSPSPFPPATLQSCGGNNDGTAFSLGWQACHSEPSASWIVSPGPRQFDFPASFEQRSSFNRSWVHQPAIPSGSAVVGHYGSIIPPITPDVVTGFSLTNPASACATPPAMMRRASSPDFFARKPFFDVDGDDDSITPLLNSLHDDIEPLPLETPVTTDYFAGVAKSLAGTNADAADFLAMQSHI